MGKHAELSDEQLVHRLLQTERDLVSARFKHSMNALENTASLRVMRREMARLKTEARAREAAQGLGKDSLLQMHGKTFGSTRGATAEAGTAEKGGFLSGIVDKLTGND